MWPAGAGGTLIWAGPNRVLTQRGMFATHRFCRYATEKFFQALSSGSIPVVMTATDVERLYAPTKDAYINAADFTGPDELAAHLKMVMQNDTLRASFSAWKKNTTLVTAWLEQQRSQTNRPGQNGAGASMCRVCMAYVKKWGCNLLNPIPEGCPAPNARGGHS